MLNLPIGKALVAYEANKKRGLKCDQYEDIDDFKCEYKGGCCEGCEIKNLDLDGQYSSFDCGELCCFKSSRTDGKDVFYKLVDYPFK